jgi:hypothetical protein
MAHPSQPFCLRCGSPIETGQRFCTHCGSTLDREANNPTAMPADRLFTPVGSPARNGLPLAPAFPAADGSTIVAPDSGPTPLRDTPAPPYAALPGSPDSGLRPGGDSVPPPPPHLRCPLLPSLRLRTHRPSTALPPLAPTRERQNALEQVCLPSSCSWPWRLAVWEGTWCFSLVQLTTRAATSRVRA